MLRVSAAVQNSCFLLMPLSREGEELYFDMRGWNAGKCTDTDSLSHTRHCTHPHAHTHTHTHTHKHTHTHTHTHTRTHTHTHTQTHTHTHTNTLMPANSTEW